VTDPLSESLVQPGFRLDRYELLCPIAEGGMAQVWVARQIGKHGFEKLVAVKTILPQFASDLRFQQMFLDEARLASRIEHTNVARILDLGEEHEVLYIVMEWIDGEAMNRIQRSLARSRVALPTGIVLRIMADVCAGLHAAHELRDREGKPAGVVHRDVSPQNILTSMDGVSKVIDFGIARAVERAAGDTTTGTLKGKIHYMAPEQALGQRIDRRADVWAVGAVLYNFFAGRPVYDGDTQLAMLHKLTSGVPPAALPSKVPLPIASIIHGALRHDPEQRWPTTEQMQLCLERAMFEIGRPTTTSTVAAFMSQYFADRSAARRRTIDTAIAVLRDQATTQPSAAAGPAPPMVVQFPASATSSSGLIDVAARTPASLVTGAKPITAPGLGPGANKESSSASLGSAALDAAPSTLREPRRSRWGLVLVGLVAASLAAAAVVVVVPRFTRHAGATTVQAAPGAPPQASSTPAASASSASSAANAANAANPRAPSTGDQPIPVTSLPVAEPSATSASASPPAARPATPKPPAPRSSGPSRPATSTKKVVDDGF
jgi:eukaryotic-like serine/threonine-protein kinase